MKRFIVTTLLLAVIVSGLTYFMPRSFDQYVSMLGANATVSIYCRQTELEGTDMGCGYKVTCESVAFFNALGQCGDVDGVSVSYEGSLQDAQNLCKFFAIKVSSEYEQDGLYVVSGRSARICNGVLIDGQVVNLQIAYRNGLIHVGSPLILGDY